jgi:trehalose 6-phosphate phosphatase
VTDRGPAGADFVQLDLKTTALLFDVDGTLIDIAPRPDAVVVPDDLRQLLARLAKATDGALALVSGRPIADLDRLFAPLVLPAIGGHGAEMRRTPGQAVEASAPLPEALRRELAAARAVDPGILIEDKSYSLALHYRAAPQAQTRLRRHIDRVCAKFPGEALEVLPGKALFEVKRPGISKGEAVGRLMARAPFAGRRPVFVGDDVTDESVFAQLPALGGVGFAVGRPFDGVAGIFGSPAALRRALAALAATI